MGVFNSSPVTLTCCNVCELVTSSTQHRAWQHVGADTCLLLSGWGVGGDREGPIKRGICPHQKPLPTVIGIFLIGIRKDSVLAFSIFPEKPEVSILM